MSPTMKTIVAAVISGATVALAGITAILATPPHVCEPCPPALAVIEDAPLAEVAPVPVLSPDAAKEPLDAGALVDPTPEP